MSPPTKWGRQALRTPVLDPSAGQPSQGLSGARMRVLLPQRPDRSRLRASVCTWATSGQRVSLPVPWCRDPELCTAQTEEGRGDTDLLAPHRRPGTAAAPPTTARTPGRGEGGPCQPALSCKGSQAEKGGRWSLLAGPGSGVRPRPLGGGGGHVSHGTAPWTLQGPPQAWWIPELVTMSPARQALHRLALCWGGACLGSVAQGQRGRGTTGAGQSWPLG